MEGGGAEGSRGMKQKRQVVCATPAAAGSRKMDGDPRRVILFGNFHPAAAGSAFFFGNRFVCSTGPENEAKEGGERERQGSVAVSFIQ